MAFINTVSETEASDEVRELYRRLQGHKAYLPGYARVYSHRPWVMYAWADLQKSIRRTIDEKNYALVTLAAARAIGSSYCALAYSKSLNRKFYSDEEMRAIVCDKDPAPLSDAEKTMMAYAQKVATDSSSVTAGDIDKLKAQGFSDAAIFDIAAVAAARCFFARLGDALGAQPDSVFLDMDPVLRQALTVGREIEAPQSDRAATREAG